MAGNPAQQLPAGTASELASIRRRAKKISRDSRELARDAAQLEEKLARYGIKLEVVQQQHNDQEEVP